MRESKYNIGTPFNGIGKPYIQGLLDEDDVDNIANKMDGWFYDPDNQVYAMTDSVSSLRWCEKCNEKRPLVKRDRDGDIKYEEKEFTYVDDNGNKFTKKVDCFIYDNIIECHNHDDELKKDEPRPLTQIIPFWKTSKFKEKDLKGRIWLLDGNDIYCALIKEDKRRPHRGR